MKKKTRALNAMKVEHSYVSINRFATLTYRNENQQEEIEYAHKYETPQSTQFPTGITSQHGSKIRRITGMTHLMEEEILSSGMSLGLTSAGWRLKLSSSAEAQSPVFDPEIQIII
jgi:hypothetical protein